MTLKDVACPADLRDVQFPLLHLVLAALLLIGAPGLAAGIVKYRSADGKVGYASPGLVPEGATVEAPNYEPDGQLSRRPRSEEAVAPKKKQPSTKEVAAVREEDARAEEAERARKHWAAKARAAQLELENAERAYETWKTRCPGVDERHSLYEVPAGCSTEDQSQLADALQKLEEKRAWVDDGLFNACRISEECLPGYIRLVE